LRQNVRDDIVEMRQSSELDSVHVFVFGNGDKTYMLVSFLYGLFGDGRPYRTNYEKIFDLSSVISLLRV